MSINPQFCRAGETGEVPRLDMPDQEMDPDTAFQVVHDELMLDGNARLNLATFDALRVPSPNHRSPAPGLRELARGSTVPTDD